MHKKKCLSIILCLLLACSCLSAVFAAAAEKPILYVSGAPALGVVEYYDLPAKQYKGYLPSLLAEFSEQYGYDVRYLPAEISDRRADKLNNTQAELITAASFESFYSPSQWNNGIAVLTVEQGGKPAEYRLLFTKAADNTLKEKLTGFVSAYPAERAYGLLLHARDGRTDSFSAILPYAAAAFLLLVVTVLLIRVRKLKRRLKTSSLQKHRDPVTGIGNDLYLHTCYKERITDKNRVLYSAVYFQLCFDTPNTKNAADELNRTLRRIAELLSDNVESDDILARVDEKGFCVIKADAERANTAEWTEQLLLQMDALMDKPTQSNLTYAGIFPLHENDRDLASIIFNAAYSSRYAKKIGRRCAEYSHSVVDSVKEENELRAALGTAFDEDQFTVYLQFFVNGTNGAILGAEALSRWNHPVKGMLSPGKYIDLLEIENRNAQFDFMILEKVCALLEELCARDHTFFISCNFSRKTIIMPRFIERFKSVIERYSFPRECLLFEITEYSVIDNTDLMYHNIENIRDMGLRIVIDDFGAGRSDIFDLGQFISDGIKLDKALVSGKTTQKDDIVLSGMIQIFAKLGITVIAEGIETQAQAERLLSLGCSIFQGYLYYLPMPVSEARRLIAKD